MKITAKTKYNLKVYQGLSRLELFQRKNPKKSLILITVIMVLAAGIMVGVDFLTNHSTHIKNYTVLPAVALIYFYYMYFLSPVIKYRSADRLADMENTFTFVDDGVEMVSVSGGYNGKCKFDYKTLYRVYETDEFIFICQDKTKIYVVDKEEVADSDEDIIRVKMEECIGERYHRCSY